MPTTKTNMTKVEKAKKVLEDAGYNLDLLFSTFDAEEAVKVAAAEEGVNVDAKALAAVVLSEISWEYYSQQINNDLEDAATKIVLETLETQKNIELPDRDIDF